MRGRFRSFSAIAWLVVALVPGTAPAHDIPSGITFRGFVKAHDDRLDLVVRVPLIMLLNLDLPKRGPGYLDLARIDPALDRAAEATSRALRLTEDGRRLRPDEVAGRISLPSNEAFDGYEEALESIHGPPLGASTNVFWNQGFFDAHLSYPIRSQDSAFGLEIDLGQGLEHRLRFVIDFIGADGQVRTFDFTGSTAEVMLNPGWPAVAAELGGAGIATVALGLAPILLLLCLVLPFARDGPGTSLPILGAAAAGQILAIASMALSGAQAGTWFALLIDVLMPAAIFYLAVENALLRSPGHRAPLACVAGIVAGFALAGGLEGQLQFAGAHPRLGLLAFLGGVVVADLVIVLAVLALARTASRVPVLARHGVLLTSILVGHESWNRLMDAGARLRMANPPDVDLAAVYPVVVWFVTLAFVALVLYVALGPLLGRRSRHLLGDTARWRAGSMPSDRA